MTTFIRVYPRADTSKQQKKNTNPVLEYFINFTMKNMSFHFDLNFVSFDKPWWMLFCRLRMFDWHVKLNIINFDRKKLLDSENHPIQLRSHEVEKQFFGMSTESNGDIERKKIARKSKHSALRSSSIREHCINEQRSYDL